MKVEFLHNISSISNKYAKEVYNFFSSGMASLEKRISRVVFSCLYYHETYNPKYSFFANILVAKNKSTAISTVDFTSIVNLILQDNIEFSDADAQRFNQNYPLRDITDNQKFVDSLERSLTCLNEKAISFIKKIIPHYDPKLENLCDVCIDIAKGKSVDDSRIIESIKTAANGNLLKVLEFLIKNLVKDKKIIETNLSYFYKFDYIPYYRDFQKNKLEVLKKLISYVPDLANVNDQMVSIVKHAATDLTGYNNYGLDDMKLALDYCEKLEQKDINDILISIARYERSNGHAKCNALVNKLNKLSLDVSQIIKELVIQNVNLLYCESFKFLLGREELTSEDFLYCINQIPSNKLSESLLNFILINHEKRQLTQDFIKELIAKSDPRDVSLRNLRLIQEKYNIVDVITPETAFGVIKLKLSSTYYYYDHLASSASCIAEFIELLRPVLINLPKSKISDLRTTLNNNFSIWYRDLKAIREKLDEIYSTASENQSVLGSVLDFFNL